MWQDHQEGHRDDEDELIICPKKRGSQYISC